MFRIAPIVAGVADWAGAETVTAPTISERQHALLRAIVTHQRTHGHSPSYRWLAQEVGLCDPSSVAYQIRQLVAKGLMLAPAGRHRALQVLVEPRTH